MRFGWVMIVGFALQRAIGPGSVVLGFDPARWVIELESVVLGFDRL